MDAAAFKYRPVVTVGTVEGYAKQNNEDPDVAVARCVGNIAKHRGMGHCLAWTNMAAAVITDNYKGKDADRAAAAARFDMATILTDGEIVEIEGRKYAIKYLGHCANPIAFKPL